MKIRLATKADADAWLAMRAALWPDAKEDELRLEVARYFVAHGEPMLPHCVFVAEDHGTLVGMLELSLRPYVDGCDSSPVPFIEAFVNEKLSADDQGKIGKALVKVTGDPELRIALETRDGFVAMPKPNANQVSAKKK